MICLQDLKSTKSLSTDLQKEKEGKLIANQIQKGDYVVLLDEKGKEYSSRDFSSFWIVFLLWGGGGWCLL